MRQREVAKQLHRHKAVLQHQRLPVHVAHPSGKVDPLIHLNPQLAGDGGRGGHHFELQHLALHLFSLLTQHLHQPGQVGGFVVNVFA